MKFENIFRRKTDTIDIPASNEEYTNLADENINEWDKLTDVEFRGDISEQESQKTNFNYGTVNKEEIIEKGELPPNVFQLNKANSKQILKRSIINGDEYLYTNDKGVTKSEKLTNKFLEKHNLGPEAIMDVDNARIAFSHPYKVGKHNAIVAYVDVGEGTKVCSYYQSNSSMNWRYLPDYVGSKKDGRAGLGWYGKGYSEESLNLPHEVQSALQALVNQGIYVLNPHDAELVFAGSARRYTTKAEYQTVLNSGQSKGSYYQEVSKTPLKSFNRLSWNKDDPASLEIPGLNAPDFDKKDTPDMPGWSELYGDVTMEHYHSKNQSLTYTLIKDSEGKACISGIEASKSRITSTGLRSEWIEAGDFATPLYEYQSQSSGYGDNINQKGPYTSMWKNYLCKMPIIQDYLKKHKQHGTI